MAAPKRLAQNSWAVSDSIGFLAGAASVFLPHYKNPEWMEWNAAMQTPQVKLVICLVASCESPILFYPSALRDGFLRLAEHHSHVSEDEKGQYCCRAFESGESSSVSG